MAWNHFCKFMRAGVGRAVSHTLPMRTICAIRPSRLASPRVARPGCLGLSAVATLSFDVKELALTTTRHHFSTTPNNAVDPESENIMHELRLRCDPCELCHAAGSVDELVSFAKQTLVRLARFCSPCSHSRGPEGADLLQGEHEPNAADSPELSLARTCLESAIDKGSMDAHVQLGTPSGRGVSSLSRMSASGVQG